MDLEQVLNGTPYGVWTEELAREVSVRGGQPDFVFKGVQVRRGQAVREVGDHLILLGHQLAIVSVKARDIQMLGKDDDRRARGWLDKNIARAAKQIAGTRRTLWALPNIRIVSDRGVDVPWDPSRVNEIYGVIVVNYSIPDDYIATEGADNVVLPMGAWSDINEALGAGGIFNYLRWRRTRQVRLRMLQERELVAEKLMEPALPPDADPRGGAWEEMEATHPSNLRRLNPDYRWARVVDAVIAVSHDHDPQFGVVDSPYHYLDIAEALERLHPDSKIELGMRILEKCRLAYEENRPRYIAFEDGDGGMIVFVSDPASREERRRLLQGLSFAVHTSTIEEGVNTAHRTVGFATEPYPSSGRSHDFVLMRGEFHLDAEQRAERDALLRDLVRPPRPVNYAVLKRLNDPGD